MSKTLGAILTIGAAIAVNVFPVVGQAISGAVLSSGVAGALGYTAAGSLAFSFSAASVITAGLTVAGLQSLAGVLGLGPSAPKPDTTETAIKTARPPRISAYGASRLYGSYILYETAADGTAVDVYAIHEGEMDAVLQYYLADDKITVSGGVVQAGADGRYGGGSVRAYLTDGSTPGTAISAVVSKLPGIWTSNHRGDGVVIMAVLSAPVKSKNFLDIYPNGVAAGSVAARWQRCPDPRAANPLDESGWTWTENAIRHLMHYMLVRERIDYASKIAPVLDYWKAAADICDQAVPLKAGGTEPRWRTCVSHKHTDTHASVKSAIMAACDGWLGTNSEGAYMVYAGSYYAPTVTIGPDQIVSFDWSGVGRDDDEAINELVCSYVSAEHDYNTVDTDAWQDEDDISERGQVLSDNLSPQVPSHGQVRRLAKRQMARINAIHRGTVTTNASGRIAKGQRYITLRLVEAGAVFYDGPAEIVALTRNVMSGGVTFSWVAADPSIDAWNPATEEGDPAPVGNRVAPEPVETPMIDSATAVLSSDGSSAQISVVVGSDSRTDLTWFLRWKLSTNTVWVESEYSDIDPGTAVQLLSDTVPVNASIDVSVSYSVGDGRTSDWSPTVTVSTSTANLAPAPNTGFSATGGSGQITGGWSNSVSSNFGHSALYLGPSADFADAAQEGADFTRNAGEGETFTVTKAAGTYYVWTVAFNAANTASSRTGPIQVSVT